jgi:cobalt/nickel transport system permease protein
VFIGKQLRDLYWHSRSVIHQIDARVKVIFTLLMIIALNLLPYRAWPAYILFQTLIFTLAILSRLGIGFMLKRSLLAAPFMLAAVPLIFTGPLPHDSVSIFNGFQVTYSAEGFARFISIALKAWISIQAAILLTAVTRFSDLLTALQQLKMPKILVAVIGLMWRYLFLLADEVTRMMRARMSRSASTPLTNRSGGNVIWRAKTTGSIAGNLFLRSIERSDRVYAAMLSRGYTGELPARDAQALPKKDARMLIAGGILLTILLLLGFVTGG